MNKVSIVFSTGRKTIHNVAEMLSRNLIQNNHLDNNEVSLIISYDPSFYGLSPNDFKIKGITKQIFENNVTYSGPNDETIDELEDLIDQESKKILFGPRGYCSQKNRALIHAIKNKSDYILFLDDDEYFIAPFKESDGSLNWKDQDIFKSHIENINNSSITNGAHTGYFSPVPSEIDLQLEKKLRERLGRILAIGNEVITEKTFINTRDAVIYGSYDFLNSPPYEVQEDKGIKFLTGGNIMLNTSSILEGKIPPYFNPVGARGEDAIMGMQLKKTKVLKIPNYTFHDPFQKYVDITKREFPDQIEAIRVTPGTVDRFYKACEGWVRYAPFLIRMTANSEEEYNYRIKKMQSELESIGQDISYSLNWTDFQKLGNTLNQHHQRSKKEIDELYKVKESWEKLVNRI